MFGRVLNIFWIGNMPKFWIWHSKYGRVLNMRTLHSILNMHWQISRVYLGSKCTRILNMQGFPQVLRTWCGLFKIWWGAWVNTWGEHEGLKTVLKNTCEGVYLSVKLPTISLQACKFTKNELLHRYFFNDFR